MQERLVFVIGAPRSGSTLLARMLGAHSAVYAPPEPHLITPLAHLGYHERVEAAPYDPVITQRGLRELVAALPGGEADYLEALRALSDGIYQRLLTSSGRRLLVDKTPAYALVLDFLARLYPRARYVVLTRHPLAVWSSQVQSFFAGDPVAAHRANPLLERYVPAIARFLRERPVSLHALRYEDLVAEPERHLEALCGFLDLPFEPAMVDYGESPAGQAEAARGLGDPVTVSRESRPTTASLDRWARDMTGRPDHVEHARRMLAGLDDADLALWHTSRRELLAQLDGVPETGGRRGGARGLSRYGFERRALVGFRRQVQRRPWLAGWVRRLREACDVLLR